VDRLGVGLAVGIGMNHAGRRRRLLDQIYGSSTAEAITPRLEGILSRHGFGPAEPTWDQNDVWLITYADQFQRAGEAPLVTLHDFYRRHLAESINGIHILPFFPWTSDDGFSISDYEQVDERYGTWADIERLSAETRVMADGVFNHMSSGSRWFERFLTGDPEYSYFFKTADPSDDLTTVVRPRTHPLLTPYESHDGLAHVWTTFSADQADLDYSNPEVLLRIVGVLLDYARRGVDAVRLDAICFLWKEPGTPSIHQPETHALVQLLRACLDSTYPNVILISETNVPHAENVSYLGSGDDTEAQAVYQFSLPPLILHAILTGRTEELTTWAGHVSEATGPGRTFFNFLGSHDGIGVRPVEGILQPDDVAFLVEATLEVGGGVNRRAMPDGTDAPYELNTTWFDIMSFGVDESMATRRHLAAHSLMLALPGIAGLYVHSLFGTSNDREGAARTGMNRTLNRRRFTDVDALARRLHTAGTRSGVVWSSLQEAIAARRGHAAFHPDADTEIMDLPVGLMGIERTAADGSRARCIANLGSCRVDLDSAGWTLPDGSAAAGEIGPLDVVWLYEVE
jgi:sucrose phosphorylase